MKFPFSLKPTEEYRFAALAEYNTERARGIVHTEEWRKRMKKEQAKFDAEMRAELEDV
jgi:hypothetical protein